LRLPCGSAMKCLSHEGALGVGGGLASTRISDARKANRFQPLVFIFERFGEKNPLSAMKPGLVL
jgi:hypothetical protein